MQNGHDKGKNCAVVCGGNDGGVSVVEEKRGDELVVRGLLAYGVVGSISGVYFYGFPGCRGVVEVLSRCWLCW